MKYLLILIIACAQNSYAAAVPFDDSSPVGTKLNRRVSEDSLSVSTNDTEPFSCDSAAAAAANAAAAAGSLTMRSVAFGARPRSFSVDAPSASTVSTRRGYWECRLNPVSYTHLTLPTNREV